ncbi:MAG: TonB-dependent receptor [Candidatus Acidiferrales bacterium]
MKMWKGVVLAVALVLSLFATTSSHAQSLQNGAVRGTVYDISHSVVPGAKVTLSNPSTGFSREQSVGADGFYSFDNVAPGVYKLHAEADGFAASEITDIHVEVGSSLVLDSTLPVKGQTQTVTVTAEAVGAVDTSTAGINQVINQRDLESLPLSGRDYRDLAELSSSAQVVPGLRGGIRLGGQQSDYASLVIDGQDSFNNFFGEFFGSLETKNFTVPLESVQEFQVVTNGFAPEFGHATGGLINVVTKSGTNEVHGEAHEYYRGNNLTATDAVGNPPNITNQNQFGGSIGFPIHKDRQFLFLATDIQRENGPLVTNFCGTGTAADCAASLASATGPVFANCTPGTTCTGPEVPLPGPGTAGFFLPAGCQTPTAGQSFLNACFGVNSLGDFNKSNNQFQNLFTVLGHYDYQLSPANHFSIRGYGTRNHTSGFTGGFGQNEVPVGFSETENFINQGVSGVFSLNTVLGRKVNEIRVSVEGETRKRHSNAPGTPTITIGSNITFGQRYYLPINGDGGKLQGADNFSYSFGKHDMKFGGDTDTFTDRKDTFVGWSSGQYEFGSLDAFNGILSSDNPTGTVSPEGLIQNLGLNGKPLFASGTLYNNYNSTLGLYWQDKWQLTPRLTLTYGLRWEGSWYPQPQTAFPGSETYTGTGSNTRTIPIPQRVPDDFKQFGPRVGLAWNVGSNEAPTVIRASWGLYYAQIPLIFMPTAGGGRTVGLFCFPPFTCPGFPASSFPYLFPNSTTLGVNQLCTTADPTNGVVYGCPGPNLVDPNFQNPRISNLTAGVEHTFARSWTVTATFAWVNSQHLRTGGYGTEEAWYRNFVQCGGAGQPPATDSFGRSILCGLLDPTLGITTNSTASYAHGNYESAVLNVTKRFSNHFQVFANYIWSENKDNGASERDTDTYFGQQDPFNLNLDYGRNGLDIKHQFKAAGVYELPWGFAVSSSLIAHSGVPYPLYIDTDINGDTVANSGALHNNDRPSLTLANGKTVLVDRYPSNQPGFVEWDARLQKDFALGERYRIQLSGDFYNLTNRANVYSNPDTSATISYAGNCTPWATLFPSSGALGSSCTPFTVAGIKAAEASANYRQINQIAPGSTPFAFQAGVKFMF